MLPTLGGSRSVGEECGKGCCLHRVALGIAPWCVTFMLVLGNVISCVWVRIVPLVVGDLLSGVEK